MFIEIRKAGFVNKGAELMLKAIIEKIGLRYSDSKLVMEPNRISAPFDKRAKLGLYQKILPGRYATLPIINSFPNFIPSSFRRMYGLVIENEIKVVFDASGFSYSDQLGISPTQHLAQLSKKWKKQGTKIILLPQAFGPFSSPKIKDAVKIIADNADLIFAREATSYSHLTDVVGKRENIKIAPDFTNLVEGVVPNYIDKENHGFCIVPNYRMIEKTSKEESKSYLPFLTSCLRYLLEKNAKPFILVHETEHDREIAEYLKTSVGTEIPIIEEEDPLKIKGILGICDATIGSRFHGLVSALSQGVPSIGTGWSHKYQMLFQEYSFEEGLIDILGEEKIYRNILEKLTTETTRQDIAQKLKIKSEQLKDASEQMWHNIFTLIDKFN
ncbi:polysaccharide pyruvyl transferase family protein [Geminocystis sp. CENA526]|uniref:polysaccharide pyruvyl transferase family protein n=1 Tax=Geminocystis sp. CENA526 TaxID=1355871 RepID=UPI003D6E8A5C